MCFPFVNIHTHSALEGAIGIRSLPYGTAADRFAAGDSCGVSVGIHPWEAAAADSRGLAEVLALPQVAAVGEIGLDMAPAWRGSADAQERVFRMQLSEAEKLNKPVVIHCVRSFERIVSILSEYDLAGVVFHGFIGSRQQALCAVGMGCYLSFGGRSLASARSVEALRAVPVDNLFAETDEGPENIEYIYDLISGITGINMELLKEKLYRNYLRLFPGIAKH